MKNKFLMGSVAVLGAGAIAVNPVATSPTLLEAQHRAVQLVADVTGSPAEVYQGILTDTVSNLTALGENWMANPFPLLSQIAANQTGYAQQIGAAIQSIPTVLQNWYENGKGESKPGAEYLANAAAAIEAGDFNTAYDNINRFMLFGLQNLAAPLTGLFLSSTDRTTGEYKPGIPEQMAQNFADAVAVVFSSSTMLTGVFQSVFAPLSGAAWEASRAGEAISTALASGDAQGAVTALVNTPGVILNAIVNGFDYQDGDTTAPWAGLLTGCIGKTGRCGSGALEQLLITIPTKIATAIANPSTTGSLTTANLLSTTSLATAADTIDTAATTEATEVETPALAAAPSTAATAGTAKAAVAATTTTDASTDAESDATTTKPATGTKSKLTGKTASDRLNATVKNLTDKVKGATSKATKSDTGAAASSSTSSTASSTAADKTTKSDSSTGKHAKKESKKDSGGKSDS
ncbi:hypothetical protein [Mycobacterium aquaticum]|uniref:PE-PGRS family protein n=1 Tax=Mycobacterium aquaticum TaxID=1927124 RepID=A0A1X0ATM7_9MYCO|nr:hypothetical protein [Mycobacterium aquaticum]ORA33255.1 hypothetical protein BST13_20165 [Mycobacterium aquaticum]